MKGKDYVCFFSFFSCAGLEIGPVMVSVMVLDMLGNGGSWFDMASNLMPGVVSV